MNAISISGHFIKFTLMIGVMIKCPKHLTRINDSHTSNFGNKKCINSKPGLQQLEVFMKHTSQQCYRKGVALQYIVYSNLCPRSR